MFNLTHFTGGIADTNGYLLTSDNTAIAFDAPEGMDAWLAAHAPRLDGLVLTHQHFDHVMDAAAIRARFSCPIYTHSPFSRDLTLEHLFGAATGTSLSVPAFSVDHILDGKTTLDLAGHTWTLLHIPGHSPDSLCFYRPDLHLLIGGDVLFMDGIGRTDFPGGSHQQLLTGIENKLLPLPDATNVHPGHGPATTIGREREENTFLN